MKDKSINNSGGVGFFGLLTIVFITLKLLGFITWTWFWVLSPLVLYSILILLALIVIALADRN